MPKLFFTGLFALGLAFPASAGQDAIYGEWETHKGGYVTFGPCEDNPELVCGHLSSLAEDHEGPGPRDVHNPDPELRDRPLLGLTIFRDFEYRGDNKWKSGEIYNTEDGKTYDSKLKLKEDGTLKMSGCVLFFCQSYEWQRRTQARADNDAVSANGGTGE